VVSWAGVTRLFLAVWLALFAVQSSDLVMVLAPDDCVQDTRGTSSDACGDDCARCVCCHRAPSLIASLTAAPTIARIVDFAALPFDTDRPSAEPHRILHVPKAS
jgi:hypothetical protein